MVRNFFYIGFLLSLFACEPDPIEPPAAPAETARIQVNPKFGSIPLYLDSVYQGANGIKIKVSDIKFFTTMMSNLNNQFSDVAYFDFREKGPLLIEKTQDFTKFSGLSFILGVDTSLNHDDPSAFSNSSPLNIMNAGTMHWGWNPGYIFISIEGKADTLVDGIDNFDLSFSYHVGTDQFLQPMSFTNLNWTTSGAHQHTLWMKLDIESFFFNPSSPIDIPNEPFTHSGAGLDALTQKVALNFKNALQVQ